MKTPVSLKYPFPLKIQNLYVQSLSAAGFYQRQNSAKLFFRREELGHSHHPNKTKANSNTVNYSMPNCLGCTHPLLGSPGVSVPSPALPSAAHTACLLGSGWLHSTAAAVLGGHPMVLASLQCWGLLPQLGCTFVNSLS